MSKKEKIRAFAQKIAWFLFNPRFLLCFGLGWLITNGWSYILLGIGTLFKINWMITVATAYLAFLWLPISPEKIVTVAFSIALLRFLFPNDKKTLAVLSQMFDKAKNEITRKKKKKPADSSEESTLSNNDKK